jgi:hypothetical protein
MKKILLTAVVAFSTLVASAQFMVVTTYDSDDGVEGMEAVTNNMGIGYMLSDAITLGASQGGVDDAGDDTHDLWARYNLSMAEGAYASLTMPGDDDEGMRIGLGFALNVWNGLYVEPNYSMPTSEDADGNRDGSFNFGLSYRF